MTAATLKLVQDMKERLHFSYSQLNTYLTCPLKYKFHYVEGRRPEQVGSALIFGKAIHEAAAAYYRGLMEEPIGESQAVEIFESHVGQSLDETPVVFKKGEDSASMLSKGKDLISLLFKRERANRVLLVEHPLESELIDDQGVVSDIVLFGILDLVEEDEEGNRIIIDLKTSGSRYDDFRVQTDQQLTFYAELAAENQLVPQEGALLRFDVLLKQKVPSLESYYAVRSVNDRRRMRKTIFRVLEAIEQGIFYPVPGFTCGDCGYKSLCMDW